MCKQISLSIGVIAIGLLSGRVAAQTCSCAAVPLVGSMQSAAPADGSVLLSTTYAFHDVSDLVAGSTTIEDSTRRDRTSDSLVFEAGFGLTEKWSLSALVSAVDHHRQVGNATTDVSGVGDAILLARFSPRNISLYSDSALSYGLGARLPIGKDDATSNGVALAEDLQPSTGASGTIAWLYWARGLNDSGSSRLYVSANYSANGDNDRKYQFGDEFSFSIGGTVQTRTAWGYGLGLSYRDAERDRRDSSEIPNTGGRWLDLDASLHYRATEFLTVSAGARYPISRELNDALQFTTQYALRTSVSYSFGNP